MKSIVTSIKKRFRRMGQPMLAPNTSVSETRPAALTMLFPDETKYLNDFAMLNYSGQGEIVDLGAWAGGSTLALAQGLSANNRIDKRSKRIHAYDIFVWEQWMSDMPWNHPLVNDFKPGDSFLPLFEYQIADYAHLIQTYPGDLNQMAEFNKPIEYLFVDIMKSWDLANTAVQKFFTKLIPHRSVVHHQDFNHFFEPWIHLLMYRFRAHFKLRKYITGTPSTVFDYLDAIPSDMLATTYDFDSFSEDEFESAFELAMSQTAPPAWPAIESARVMAFVHHGDTDRAKAEFAALRQKYPGNDYDVLELQKTIAR